MKLSLSETVPEEFQLNENDAMEMDGVQECDVSCGENQLLTKPKNCKNQIL